MKHWGILFTALIIVMGWTSGVFADTSWNATTGTWSNGDHWTGGVPDATDTYIYIRYSSSSVCNLNSNEGLFPARLVMQNGQTLNIQSGGYVGTGWARVGHESAATVNVTGTGTFVLNEDDLWLGTDGGSCTWTMSDTSSLITVSTDGNPEELFIADDGGSATFKLVGSNVTVSLQGLHLGINSGTPNATLEFEMDASGASTIAAESVYIAESGNAYLVLNGSVGLLEEDIVLIENTGSSAVGGTGVFTAVNGSSAAEGATVDVGGNSYTLTYQYDATGDSADNDIALLYVGPTPYASEPSPVLGETTDADETVLSWRSAQGIVRNEIYLGTSQTTVANAQKPEGDVNGDGMVDLADLSELALQWLLTPSAPCPDLDYSGIVDLPDLAKISRDWKDSADAIYAGSTSDSTFDPGFLEPGLTYYWRVDSVFCDGIVAGPVWSFETKLPAFPGADGFGKWASGGRGGSVYHVTNLNDSGSGSFRDAVSATNRTVVFDVSGIINIGSRIVVSKDVTIAGQTAPGEGIMIYGDGLSYTDANRSITRYMRYRMGIGGTSDKDAVGIADGRDMIFDHCSISWGRDENFSISGGTGEDPGLITIQDCIIAQGLVSHSCGGLLIDWEDGISVLRSLYIDNDTRNPKVRGINEFINNVVYHWDDGGYIMAWTDSLDYYSYVNAINNYFISGPGISETTPFRYGNSSFHIYHSNNWYDYDEDGVFDGRVLTDDDYTWNNETVVDEPFDYPGVKTLLSPRAAVKSIGSVCGASLPARDQTDERLIQELMSYGTLGEFISDENASPMYGVGTLESGICPTDTDQDGMPDYWEDSIAGLNFDVADNNGDVNGNGYTNLEDYLNWLGTLHAEVQKNDYVDIELRNFTAGFDGGATYSVSDATHGTVVIQADGHTARYTPNTDYVGLAEFSFTVNDGDAISATVQILISQPPRPSPPTGLWAQGTNTQVSLDWQNNGDPGLAGYNIYRTTTSGSAYIQINASLVTTSDYVDPDVVNGTLYHYVVRAVDTFMNESGDTNEVSARPVASGTGVIIQEKTAGFYGVDGTIDNNNAGFTGSGFANTDNVSENGVDWKVIIATAGTYTITWRYANGGGSDRPAALLVDGSTAIASISFPALSSSDWTIWSTVSRTVSLTAGIKDLRLQATGASGLGNIDYIEIAGVDVTPADTLQLYLAFDEMSGTEAGDASMYDRSGQLVNSPTWDPGYVGGAITFDGSDDYVEVTGYQGITGAASRTCSAWIKTTSIQQGNIVSWGDELAGQKWMFRVESDGTLGVGVWGGYINSVDTVNDDQWHHVAAVLSDDGNPSVSEILFYVDGVLKSTVPSNTQAINTTAAQNVLIGAFDNAGILASYFSGMIDDVRIYDIALTEQEILDLN